MMEASLLFAWEQTMWSEQREVKPQILVLLLKKHGIRYHVILMAQKAEPQEDPLEIV